MVIHNMINRLLHRNRTAIIHALFGGSINVTCAVGVKVSEKAWLNNVNIGKATYIGDYCSLDNCSIGKYCSIGKHVSVIRGNHPSRDFVSTHPAFFSLQGQSGCQYAERTIFQEFKYADKRRKIAVKIENDVWIGNNVIMKEGVTIGNGAIIGAGTVVVKDVKPYEIVGGNPAETIRYRFRKEEILFLQQLQWWNKSDKWLKKYAPYFNDVKRLMHVLSQENMID